MGSPLAFTKISPLNSLAFRPPKEPLPSQLPIFPFSSFSGEICISWAITPTSFSGEICISWAITPTAMWAHDRHVVSWMVKEPAYSLCLGHLVVPHYQLGGAGRVVFDWVTNAKAKEAKALLAWRKSKIEAMQANTAELKAIKEALKMPKESAKEPAKETFFRVCDT